MFLTNPASYITLADLKNDTALDLTDRKGAAIPDAVLSEWLEEESGSLDALIGTSFLPQEQKIRVMGNGSNFMPVNRFPLIYIKQVKIVLPNSVGFDVPVQSLLVDFEAGTLQNMTPLTFQGIGVTTLFPDRLPIDVTAAWGLGFAIAPPTFVASAAGAQAGTPFAPGSYDVYVSSVTYSGESLPSPAQTVTLSSGGAISVLITNSPGAMRYYVYVCPHGDPSTSAIFYAETQGFAIGAGTISTLFDASVPTDVVAFNSDGSRKAPATVDTSAAPFQGKYAGLRKALKLMIQSRVWELKNPSNQGIYQQRSGPKTVSFKDGTKSTFQKLLDDLVDSFSYQGIL